MGGMPMAGGGPIEAAPVFMLMWVGMMVVMMLPVLAPVLGSYHRSRPTGKPGTLGATAAVAAAYYAVWALFGIFAFGLTQLVGRAESNSAGLARFATLGIGGLLLLIGSFQFTPCKSRYLDRCRSRVGEFSQSRSVRQGWLFGWRLGMDCVVCCLGFMLLLLAVGMTNLQLMIVVGAAITVERLAPWPRLASRFTGAGEFVLGILAIARTLA
jgi:predicted metal-binding membrane protein